MRRGIALDLANVCSFESHSLLVELYFSAMLEPPPPGYAHVSRSQVRNADALLWWLIAKECRHGIKKDSTGVTTFESALKSLMFDPRFRLPFMPLPAGSSGAAAVNLTGGMLRYII